ncbi:MAG: hypothetical protein AB1486_15030 [Planctomycetota bacterium]
MNRLARCLLAIVTPALAPLAVAEDNAPTLAIVYIEPNVGGASGGHIALRIDEEVYHFQRGGRERLELIREEWPCFEHSYAGLQNRSLLLARLELSPDVVQRIRDHLTLVYARQQEDTYRHERLVRDRAWLEGLAGVAPLPALPAAGLFTVSPTRGTGALRERVRQHFGNTFIEKRLRVAEAIIADLAASDGADLESYREALLEREALRAIDEGRAVAAEALLEIDAAPSLTDVELSSLVALERALEQATLALLNSSRPDRGQSLLVTLARWQVVGLSLERKRLILLDALPDDAASFSPEALGGASAVQGLAARAARVFTEVRQATLDGDLPDETHYNLLEEIATRYQELERGARGETMRHEPSRLLSARLVPARGRVVEGAVLKWDPEPRLLKLREELERSRQALATRYEYDLLARNCVTELVRAINDSFPDAAGAERALGERLEPGARWTFWPSVLFDRVATHWRVSSITLVPSYRRRELAHLYREEFPPLVYLREATTLTSTIYTPRAEDGAFLLFTDDAALLRPLYGAVNLAYGLMSALVGLPLSLFDDGERLSAGLNGAFYSLPELAFLNIRKGTFADVEAEPGSRGRRQDRAVPAQNPCGRAP